MKIASKNNRPPLSIEARAKLTVGAGLLTILVAIVIAEIGLRMHYSKIERITGVVPWETAAWEGLTYFWDEYHPRYGWSNLPGYRSDERVPFKVTINDQGLRAQRNYSKRPPTGMKRIAVFGDSCTFGEEVHDHQTVPFHLEQYLDGAEALNFGVRGYGLGQMALRLEEEGFGFQPNHVIIVILLPSDITRDLTDYFTHGKPRFHMTDSGLQIDNFPVPKSTDQTWLYRHSFAAAWMWGRPQRWPEQTRLDEVMKVPRGILKKVRAQCRGKGVRLTLATVVTPGTIELMNSDPIERQRIKSMIESLRQTDIQLIDLVDDLETAYAQHGDALCAPIAHWSSAGNRFIARQIAAGLDAAPKPDQ